MADAPAPEDPRGAEIAALRTIVRQARAVRDAQKQREKFAYNEDWKKRARKEEAELDKMLLAYSRAMKPKQSALF